MNRSIILHILGWIMSFEAAFMVLPIIVAMVYGEKSGYAFLITIGICLLIGLPLIFRKPKKQGFLCQGGIRIRCFRMDNTKLYGFSSFLY